MRYRVLPGAPFGRTGLLAVGPLGLWGTSSDCRGSAMTTSRFDPFSLPRGRHDYKFIVDGDWVEDPKAEAAPNCYGTMNSVCEVGE